MTLNASSEVLSGGLPPVDLGDTARLAYIYGLPAYEVARLRYRALSLPRKGGGRMPLNTFWHTTALTGPGTADVTAVNTDTMLSRAWIDLSCGPLIIDLPRDAERYFSLALMDLHTNNFAVLGSRRQGPTCGRALLVDPGWDGAPPTGLPVIRAPTHTVWALVRVLVDGPDDVPAVCALQQRFGLSRWGEPSKETGGSRDPLAHPILPLDASKPLVFFDVLNTLLTENAPLDQDKPVLERLARIGVGPGRRFRRGDFSDTQLQALRRGLAAGREALRAQVGFRTEAARRGESRHWPSDDLLAELRASAGVREARDRRDRRLGWSGPVGPVGDFGADFLLRAQCALAGLGLLPRREAMYFTTATDAAGDTLDGRRDYTLRFPAGGLPPVAAFWSLTAYQSDDNNRRWLAPNALDRYSLGSRNTDLRHAADGSLTITIQHRAPAQNLQNWLPAPDAPFMLTLRAYRPGSDLLEGTYEIPEVRAEQQRPVP